MWSSRRTVGIVGLAAVVLCGVSLRASGHLDELSVSVDSRSQQPGELLLVTLTGASAASEVRVGAFGRTITAYATAREQWQALVPIDLEQATGRYDLIATARVGARTARATRTIVVEPKVFSTRTLKVAASFVNPPAKARARIAREALVVRSAYATSAPQRLWNTPFVAPVNEPANSRFGQRSIFNGQPRSRHSGTDFLSPAGTPVKAPNAGRVVVAQDLFMSGNTVIIDHGLNLFSMMAHLQAIDVRDGDMVMAGQIVGRVGATGRVTGPHLHWAMRASGARVDPLSAVALLGDQISTAR